MYDRSDMHRAPSYTYPQYTVTPTPSKTYPTAHHTSSAFSASANPNEDWTKISDLAERRRIQNRIAQRNYRKKLKKRLEDLERRAGSSSASPEQKHEELPEPDSTSEDQSPQPTQRQRSSSNQIRRDRTPDILPQQYVLPSDDRGMFSHQFTRQLSTSPPPFSYGALSTVDNLQYSTYPPNSSYCTLPGNGIDMQLYPSYLQTPQQHYSHAPSLTTPPIKQEYYNDDESNPFSMSYATMAGIDLSTAESYHDLPAYTPPLLDSFDYYQAESPTDSAAYPRTPPPMFCN